MGGIIKKVILGLVSGLLLTACATDDATTKDEKVAASSTPTAVATPEETPAPIAPKEPVTVAFAGDIHFEGELEKLLAQPNNGRKLPSELKDADYAVTNLEAALATKGGPTEKELEDPSQRYHFSTDKRALDFLEVAGIDLVSVANNHGVDYGREGLKETLKIKAESSLPIVGVGTSQEDAYTPELVEIKDQQFAFFAADASKLESKNTIWRAGKNNAGLASLRSEQEIRLFTEKIEAAKTLGAAVIVYLHWGTENTSCMDPNQGKLAKRLSQAGASAILGSHTHQLVGSGWLNKNTYVSYGLGNFLWYHGNTPETGVLSLTFEAGKVVKDNFAPYEIPEYGGFPIPAARPKTAVADWRKLNECTNLRSTPEPKKIFTARTTPLKKTSPQLKHSWREGCPVPPADLRLITLFHYDFNGKIQEGQIVVAKQAVGPTIKAFKKMFQLKYPIASLTPVSAYGGDDDKSMAANNSSGFNCRVVHGTSGYSKHAYGVAIDLNPVQNPYLVGGEVLPPNGNKWAQQRPAGEPGLLTASHPLVKFMEENGWTWGGRWTSTPDYQHFVLE